ncbi:DUF4399 domain-containing protein [Paracraurococcus ruber]|uniref:DUF4399 domain-containing protein n=1 Tax=Paracraurococcus ruber TaxID=77675 RepID=A0ABS1CYP7_9PROT|nr:DUF4399 domain-containing protein [Paracraurococcus ruber]MBK1659331.1 hypothetical protein [Paracraurococcus ruber]TDG29814.1 DUF4399 domain-containing protein [Paracraurococcus ruber]
MPSTRRHLLLASAAMLPAAAGQAAAQTRAPDHAHAAPAATAAAEAPRPRSAAPKDAYVYIGWPQDGQVISGTRFKVWFGTRNFGVAPAGVTTANTGHHHIIVDAPLPALDRPIPNDRNHLHFGLGQTETMLELPPGVHTLQLLMGDADHIPHDPPVMSKRITVTVRPGRPQAVAASQPQ